MLNLLDPVADIDTNGYCYCHGDCNSYCHCYGNCNSYCYCHCYCYSYGYANVDVYSYSYCDHDTYTPAYSVTKGYCTTKAAADSPAETVSVACDGKRLDIQHSKFNIQRSMKSSKTLLALIVATTLGCTAASSANAAIINLMPSKDNTLYEFDPKEGDNSNGAGFHFFAGMTVMSELRRGVLAFDVAGNIPPGSVITSVTLTMNMSRTLGDTARIVELHKLLADWGEGTSHAPGEEGDGAPATTNDATWRHRFFDTIFWAMQGGDFSATVSASQSVGPVGQYTWSSAQMVADVQSWVNDPASNFGWLVLGDESAIATTKRFDTRESASPPVLTIQYISRSAPTPRPHPTPPPRP